MVSNSSGPKKRKKEKECLSCVAARFRERVWVIVFKFKIEYLRAILELLPTPKQITH